MPLPHDRLSMPSVAVARLSLIIASPAVLSKQPCNGGLSLCSLTTKLVLGVTSFALWFAAVKLQLMGLPYCLTNL